MFSSPLNQDSNAQFISGVAPASQYVCTTNGTFSSSPTLSPTISILPSFAPTPEPSFLPTYAPTHIPSPAPSGYPTMVPSSNPSATPSDMPSPAPSVVPTPLPSYTPTNAPTQLCVEGQYISGSICVNCPAGTT
jgi:hypothetical protein